MSKETNNIEKLRARRRLVIRDGGVGIFVENGKKYRIDGMQIHEITDKEPTYRVLYGEARLAELRNKRSN